MQDNAPIHTALRVCGWFRLKEYLADHYPDLEEGVLEQDAMEECISAAFKEAWNALPEEFLHDLIDSMTTRINSVIAADGWYTRF